MNNFLVKKLAKMHEIKKLLQPAQNKRDRLFLFVNRRIFGNSLFAQIYDSFSSRAAFLYKQSKFCGLPRSLLVAPGAAPDKCLGLLCHEKILKAIYYFQGGFDRSDLQKLWARGK